MPTIAILFWFYKDPALCENRLHILKKHNPDAKIFGLYGGPHEDSEIFEKQLAPYLDHFYISEKTDSDWKWIHGDLVILEWYNAVGKELAWDSIAVVQWDMLLFDSLQALFPDIQKGEIYFSGVRDLTPELEQAWWHTSATEEIVENYQSFLQYVRKHYQYEKNPPPCCQFIFEIFPRQFFAKYNTVENKELGMLEYKVPIYAEIFNIPLYRKNLGTVWEDVNENLTTAPMNASPRGELKKEYIASELAKKDGWRMFHPYQQVWE